jgi:hypothetical protein
MAFLPIADVITRKQVAPGITDNIFGSGPTLAYLRANALKTWQGGGVNTWQETFFYDVLNGQFFKAAPTFDISQKQIENATTWDARKAGVSVTAEIDKLRVEYAGEGALFDYVDERLQNSALTMSEGLASAIFRNGQTAGRTEMLNGLEEALNDGVTASFAGNTFTSYGTVLRSSVRVAGRPLGALDSPMTAPAAAVSGPITYPLMEQYYSSVSYGQEEPNLIVTTPLGMSYIKMAFQAQQRFTEQSRTTRFGFTGIEFNNAMIVADRYCPGTAGGSALALGQSSNDADGETLWFLNVKKEHMGLWLSNDDLMGFGFTGWKPAQDNLTAVGQYLFAGNFTVRNTRYHRYAHAITG